MSPSKSFQIKLLALVVFSLVMAVLLLYPAHSLNAQALDNPADQPKYASETAVDDALFLWQNESAPFVQKPDTLVNLPDDAKETQQFAHTLYLPGMSNEIDAANVAATTAAWHTIHYQTFESNFPTAGWTIADYNGPSVGGSLVWDDNATRGYNSYWAAHPNDSSTYANLTDTWMRYGPFSLVGATSARFTFVYWLNSEANYDLFSWDVICNGLAHSGLGQTRSGPLNKWTSTNIALTNCLGKSQVYIRFSFKSDYNGTGQGVWVDNVKIEKYQ